MKFQHTTICINADYPICQSGFIQQINPISEIHDNLYARILAFEDEHYRLYLISCDNLGLPVHVQIELEKRLQATCEKELHVTISSTHTHFAPTPHSPQYCQDVLDKLYHACMSLTLQEKNLGITYKRAFFDGLGKSRISHHDAKHIYVNLLEIYDEHKRIMTLIIHNAHPTIHNGDTPYFTAEYPGYVLAQLQKTYPDEAFTFMQGADGDISTRFTRSSQDWNGMVELGDKLIVQIQNMRAEDCPIHPLQTLDYACIHFPLEHEFHPIDISNLPDYLTPRERETIQIGAKVRESLATKLDTLPKEILLSKVVLGDYILVFSPNELFSSYHDYIQLEHAILVCYSNGYSRYVTGLHDDFITYETFTDTLTKACKKQYAQHLAYLGK